MKAAIEMTNIDFLGWGGQPGKEGKFELFDFVFICLDRLFSLFMRISSFLLVSSLPPPLLHVDPFQLRLSRLVIFLLLLFFSFGGVSNHHSHIFALLLPTATLHLPPPPLSSTLYQSFLPAVAVVGGGCPWISLPPPMPLPVLYMLGGWWYFCQLLRGDYYCFCQLLCYADVDVGHWRRFSNSPPLPPSPHYLSFVMNYSCPMDDVIKTASVIIWLY